MNSKLSPLEDKAYRLRSRMGLSESRRAARDRDLFGCVNELLWLGTLSDSQLNRLLALQAQREQQDQAAHQSLLAEIERMRR
ncbi:hypothetical protein [Roseiconus lacunae]|uniref:Uncharacterized protein n=1 Tax=Roseiconus lacunae TaxID=2605694 RepID=A0ABT7PEG6_9BACT|nr:hypothetical protein [Roseiconus lacunae]MDM4014885.1 hypothetical protein [Roseiconus lacunae]